MSVFRVNKNSNYTVMSNNHFKEKNMSLKAMGLLSLMLSLPQDWDYSIAGLSKICNDGKDSIRSALKELEDFGYLKRTQDFDEERKFKGYVYDIYEEPLEKNADFPLSENPTTENPMTENPTQLNTKELSTKELSTNIKVSKKKGDAKTAKKKTKKEKNEINEQKQEYELLELKRVKETVIQKVENVLLQKKILNFLNFRIKNKKPVTIEYIRVFLEKLDKLSNFNDNEKIEILNQSIERGYTTIYAVNKNSNFNFNRYNKTISTPESYDTSEYEIITSSEDYLDNAMDLL